MRIQRFPLAIAAAAGVLALAAIRSAAAQQIAQQTAKPVVAVLNFDNNSIGKDRADYDGLGKGVADMLITDLAANPRLVLVDRDRIQQVLAEQNLTKAGSIDPQTAVQLGKILQAQYMVVGGFMSDGRGNMVLTSRAIEVQTTRIMTPEKVQAKGDDVLGLIAQLSGKLQNDLKLPAIRVSESAPHTAEPTPAGEPRVSTPAAAESRAPSAERRPAAKPSRKMDTRTALLYAKALDESDQGHAAKAAELFHAVLDRFPDYAPAQNRLAKLGSQ